ncbi:amino acid adenylation domain-containing protein [Streptomyces inhibens]|uniref:Amino acid adenylation domain-containing protein n=1 Tax=Streptomyces inhibens TaxID=2293571 RepID=A0A371PX59_STRIH|nr:non-ribosomal peptide synthetase [Streptomyces inhibens]REK87018.1 amino acid adenylation domain-containing protein [Streptomyces inhibens]
MADLSRKPADALLRFRQAVRDHPDRTAVRGGDEALTFAELDRRTARLARTLAAHGVGRGDRVGVALPRGARLVVALLAVWRAGAAYVPLDPQYPYARRVFMARDAGLQVLLAEEGTLLESTTVLVIDPSDLAEPAGDALTGDVTSSPLDPAYVIYTSGSTGRPKGVETSRGGVASLLTALEDVGAYASEPRVVAWNASVSFDASVQQWARVCRGDTVVVLTDEDRKDPARLGALLDEHRVTDLDLTPSHWELLRGPLTAPRADGRTLRLFMGGEPVPERTWREIAEPAGLEGLNLYGPTECTVDATAAWMTGEVPHLGGALPGNRLYVLDDELSPAPEGVDGELYIAGPRLAHGYVNRPGLTAERFVADPFGAPGARMYRTGDRVRRTPDGNLAFLGRADRQLKFRGFRMEPGEIECVLRSHEEVAGAVVVVHHDGPAGEQLVAYCVPAGDTVPRAGQLREHVAAALPDFMVPSAYVPLSALPLTPNGKLDTDALPLPQDVAEDAQGTAAEPDGPFEKLIAEVWSEVLGKRRISADDDFFALGGHSLMALRVVGRLKRNLGVVISVKEVYRHPRLRDLAHHVETRNDSSAPPR